MRRLVFGLGTLQVVVTGGFITFVFYYFFQVPLRPSVLIGPTLALSSTAFVLQLLIEQKKLKSEYGRTSFSILLFQDLAVVPLLALVSILTVPELKIGQDILVALTKSLGVLAIVIVGGRYFLHPVLHRVARFGTSEVFTASAVLLVLGTAVVTAQIGLSMAMGAFVAGLLIADSDYRHQVLGEIQPFRGLLLGLFFMSMGMALNLGLFFDRPFIFLSLTAGLLLVNTLLLWPLSRIFGLNSKNALATALILAQSGEFALVLFALAEESGLLSPPLFQQLLVVVLLSMLATPLLARAAYKLSLQRRDRSKSNIPEEAPEVPIVIAGFGRVGRRIGQILKMAEKSFIALDIDAALVARERSDGYPVFFGDAQRPEVLKAAGAGKAHLVIVTLNDFESTERVVASLRHSHPELSVLARGHNLEQCRALHRLGARVVVSENIEASLKLAEEALIRVGIKGGENESLINQFREDYYKQIAAVLQADEIK